MNHIQKKKSDLRTLLSITGLKQRHLASHFGVSESYISLILDGERPGVSIRDRIASYLKSHISLTKNLAA